MDTELAALNTVDGPASKRFSVRLAFLTTTFCHVFGTCPGEFAHCIARRLAPGQLLGPDE